MRRERGKNANGTKITLILGREKYGTAKKVEKGREEKTLER